MGIVRGLKGINKYNEEQAEKKKAAERPKTVWLKFEEDNPKIEVAFLQELDEESPNYSTKNGIGFLATEHTNPDNWKRKALCTMDEQGQCYGCERHKEDYTAGWKGKTRLYINVLVKDGKNDPYVAVMSQSNSGQSITPTLIEEAGDEETITTKWFSVSKAGKGTETNYTLRAKKEHGLNVEDYEVFDLEKILRDLPYDQQEAHYLDGETRPAASEQNGNVAAPAADNTDSSSVVW